MSNTEVRIMIMTYTANLVNSANKGKKGKVVPVL
jgi:hypothetical protein